MVEVSLNKLKEIWAKRGTKRLTEELKWREGELSKAEKNLARMKREKKALERHLENK